MEFPKIEEYYEMYDDLYSVNEAKMPNILKRSWYLFNSRLSALIGPKDLDKAINNDGKLDPGIINLAGIDDADNTLESIFNQVRNQISEGKYFLNGIKNLEEFAANEDKIYAMEAAKGVMGKENKYNTKPNVGKLAGGALAKRATQFDLAYKKQQQALNKRAEGEIGKFIQKMGKTLGPKYSDRALLRKENANTILLMIEYELKKRRWEVEDLGNLTNEMKIAYKKATDLKKDIATGIKEIDTATKDQEDSELLQELEQEYPIGSSINLKTPEGETRPVTVNGYQNGKVQFDVDGDNKELNPEKFQNLIITPEKENQKGVAGFTEQQKAKQQIEKEYSVGDPVNLKATDKSTREGKIKDINDDNIVVTVDGKDIPIKHEIFLKINVNVPGEGGVEAQPKEDTAKKNIQNQYVIGDDASIRVKGGGEETVRILDLRDDAVSINYNNDTHDISYVRFQGMLKNLEDKEFAKKTPKDKNRDKIRKMYHIGEQIKVTDSAGEIRKTKIMDWNDTHVILKTKTKEIPISNEKFLTIVVNDDGSSDEFPAVKRRAKKKAPDPDGQDQGEQDQGEQDQGEQDQGEQGQTESKKKSKSEEAYQDAYQQNESKVWWNLDYKAK